VFETDPPQATGGAPVEVDLTAAQGGWTVTVLIRGSPGTSIDAAAVDVELIDARGCAVPPSERPEGALVQIGGSLSATTNAVFRFPGSRPPQEVVVRWAGELVRFRVISR
jgi:hypothetical protein